MKILGVMIYIQTSSVRKTAKILSELHPVSKSVVQLIKKFGERLPIVAEKKPRNVVAIDETVVKANGEKYYVYATIENELILMNSTLREILIIPEVLKYCENKPKFIIEAPCVKAPKSLGLKY